MELDLEKISSQLADSTTKAFSAFCEDISGMFDVAADCVSLSSGTGKAADLKKDFKKFVSINHVQSKGTLHGKFDLVFDQAATFVIAGIFVMLPEKRILEYTRNGLSGESNFIQDAIREAGNLLVGSWDRVFRVNLEGHEHFVQDGTKVGDPWDKPQEHFSFSPDEDCFYSICKLKIAPYPDLMCAAIFPLSALAPEVREAETPPAAPAAPEKDVAPATAAEAPAVDPQIKESASPGPIRQAIDELTRSAGDQTALTINPELGSLTAAQIMKPAVLWVDPEDTIEQVTKQMQQNEVGYVLVGRDHQVEGLVSRSDIAAAVSPYLRNVFAHLKRPLDDASLQIRIRWFMSRPVHSVGPHSSISQVIHTMFKFGIRGLPVIDKEGSVLGFITVFDILQALASDRDSNLSGKPSQVPVLLQE